MRYSRFKEMVQFCLNIQVSLDTQPVTTRMVSKAFAKSCGAGQPTAP